MSTQTTSYLVEDYQEFRSSNPELVAAWYQRWQWPRPLPLPLPPSPQLPLPPPLPSSDTSSSKPAWDKATLPIFNDDPKFATKRFEVRESAGAGLGAFSKGIKEGEVVMAEKPLFVEKDNYLVRLWDKISGLSEKDTGAYYSLHGHVRGGGEVTSDNRVTSIFTTNRFRTIEGECGIFIKCSRFNHQCRPYSNCAYKYHVEDNQLVVTARRDISKGEEITISYSSYPETLFGNYGFNCNCPGCVGKGALIKKNLAECQVL